MKIKSLRDVYIPELKDLYSAEKQLITALPKMAKAAVNEQLAAAFEEHLEQTQEQLQRLEQILEELGESTKSDKCKGMEGLLAEGSKVMKEEGVKEVIDALLITAAQKVEHYEIAGYGSARTFAEMLGENEAADLLQQTLDEEIETDERLTDIAETAVNTQAGARSSE
ncbi:MAG: ferritin-like domain-containing protein [Verrucomicrobiota bacterium]|nr:ferritin-like domain-containing protein [Verrucomicrobiota bacterium]